MSIGHPDYSISVLGPPTVPATHERRSLILNDDGVVDRAIYPIQYSSETYKGKFFTRGCRGMLESIQVYCDGDGVDTLTIRYSPHPCLGPLGEVSIVPANGYAWQDFPIEEMWNYDSLFIWIYACTANITWGYDAALPYDGHESADAGATWADLAIRPFIRAVYTGETPGDVPVSGIVNTIPIPNIASEISVGINPNLPNAAYTNICTESGAGTMLEARVYFQTSVTPTAGIVAGVVRYELHIYADGALAYHTSNRIICQSEVAAFGRSSTGEFYQATVADPAYDMTVLAVRIPIQYRREIRMDVFQSTGAVVSTTGHIFANELR